MAEDPPGLTSYKEAFKYYAILLGGGGESLKRSQKITGGRGGVHQKITEDHDHIKKNWSN